MTFLPVVQRELRLASRRRNTYWMRIIAAVAALAISTGFLSISALAGSGMRNLGHPLLATLAWLAAGAAACAGLFFTSDSLSQEKREGTLGLLFLTDLRGYDV